MKLSKKLIVVTAAIALSWAGFSSAQEFGAIRPAAAPIVKNPNRLDLQDSPQDKDQQDAVPPLIEAPKRPDEQGLPDVVLGDDPIQQKRVAFGPWPNKKIGEIRVDIRELSDEAPKDRSSQLIGFSDKQWTEFTPTPKVFAWAAPDIRYQPLYFEDVALERYGQTRPWIQQTALSGLRMTGQFFLFPHHAYHDPIFSCDYPLGFCRPGDKVDHTLQLQYLGHPNR